MTRPRTIRRPRIAPVLVLVLLAGVLATAAAYAKAYMSNNVRGRASRPTRLVVLPPHAEFIKDKMIISDQMVAEAAALEREAAEALKTQLEAKGYKVRVATPQEIARTPGLTAVVKKANDRYEEEWSKLVYKPKKIREHRYTVGPEAVKLCAMLRADSIVVTRIVAVGVSKGKATMRAIFGSSAPHSYARLDFGLIEARQGFIEGYFIGFENTSLSQLTKKPEVVMGQAAENALKKYPASTEDLPLLDVAVEAASEDEGGADPVGDFEALLGKGAGAQGQR